MVEAITAGVEEMALENITEGDMKPLTNGPRYMESADAEIDKLMTNAKIDTTELGIDLDQENMFPIEEENKEEAKVGELERLMGGGLPFCCQEKDCGHTCDGVKHEAKCLPCLEEGCKNGRNLPTKDELCNICYTSELNEEPSIQLGCGHIFHAGCVIKLITSKWSTLRITFSFLSCPQCKAPLEVEHVDEVADELEKMTLLRSELQVKAMKVARDQGLDQNERLNTPGDHFFNNLMAFAEAKVSFYMCSKCTKPYFGGLLDCGQEMVMEDTTRKEDLFCRPCLMKEMSIGANKCKKGHGAEFIDWKCMFCCSVATFCCGGYYWFCEGCHELYVRTPIKDCKGRNRRYKRCPLGVPHPRPGVDPKKSAYPLGCSLCRSTHLDQFDKAQAKIRALIQEEEPTVVARFDSKPLAAQKEDIKAAGDGMQRGKKAPMPMNPIRKAALKARADKKKKEEKAAAAAKIAAAKRIADRAANKKK